FCYFFCLINGENSLYKIGVGIADTTGPPVDIVFMAYGNFDQKGTGIHLRTFSRAYIIEKNNEIFVFVSVESAMISHNVRAEVIDKLKKKYNNTFTDKNVMISASHTHSAPGGSNNYALYDISIYGFVKDSFDALVNGITKSIEEAKENMVHGRIFINHGKVYDVNINRSPLAYKQNPEAERNKYDDDVDKIMTQVKFIEANSQRPIGVINWFAVHSTSMNNTNTLVSSDNFGYASLLFEKKMNKKNKYTNNKNKFVASFCVTNAGDSSPNIKGPRCQFSNKPCNSVDGCDEDEGKCVASGPGKNMFESTSIIAHRLFHGSMNIWNNGSGKELTGEIRVVHQYVNMTEQTVDYYDSSTNKTVNVKGCQPAMGESFTTGTSDGPGVELYQKKKEFTVLDIFLSPSELLKKSQTKLLETIIDCVKIADTENEKCHGSKKIIIPQKISLGKCVGLFSDEILIMLPDVVSTQIAFIGDLIIAGVPGEFTTMAGRRLKEKIQNIVNDNEKNVVIAGLCNTYSDYITTPEEYQLQLYEGGSTIFGPHTLTIYLKQYEKLASAAINMNNLTEGIPPEILDHLYLSAFFSPEKLVEDKSYNSEEPYGSCVEQPKMTVVSGDTVSAVFLAGNPRHSLMNISSYLFIEQQISNDNNNWNIVATDADWETKFEWKSGKTTISWNIPKNIEPGKYRISHQGHYKNDGTIFHYYNSTQTFEASKI
ncbi:neutral ceramidase-like, partial [Aphidius gifuensis]|uniref:neutral ceramidase-like n=1 Tax=Aphidius gifuensis TaxID=684658 RepID=UPI001CDB96BE